MVKSICKMITIWCMSISCVALAQRPNDVDGPYIFYKDNHISITSIEKNEDLLKSKAIRYIYRDKANIVLNVTPENHPKYAFQVCLKQKLQADLSVHLATGKLLFVSDIEGEFVNLRRILLAAKVIDKYYHWIYGSGCLVIAGDLFDRGKDVVPELWLLYKLEDEAAACGGAVITILGNHDVMNLSGDHRYTDAKYFKTAWLMKTSIDSLFGADTELGRWLRSKNLVEKVGDVLVTHGGLSPAWLNFSLEELNHRYQPYDKQREPDRNAPFWYRGYFIAPKVSMAEVDRTLAAYDCKYIVVGHTIVKWNIASYYKGKVIGVDVDEHKGEPQAALYSSGQWQVIYGSGKLQTLQYRPANDQISEKDIL